VEVPTTIVWGARDRFLGVSMVEPSLAMCSQGRAEVVDDATHWIQHEEPELVTREILAAVDVL
jgi:pimeloyl-ACP methyl ester carboxylesterase